MMTTRPIRKFMHVTYVRCSVMLWRRCNTLCTSGLRITLYLHIMSHMRGVGVTLKQPADHRNGSARRLGLARPWVLARLWVVAEAAACKPVTLFEYQLRLG